MVYSLSGVTNYGTEFHTAVEPGTHIVHYGVQGNDNYNGEFGGDSWKIEVTIVPLSVSENDIKRVTGYGVGVTGK